MTTKHQTVLHEIAEDYSPQTHQACKQFLKNHPDYQVKDVGIFVRKVNLINDPLHNARGSVLKASFNSD